MVTLSVCLSVWVCVLRGVCVCMDANVSISRRRWQQQRRCRCGRVFAYIRMGTQSSIKGFLLLLPPPPLLYIHIFTNSGKNSAEPFSSLLSLPFAFLLFFISSFFPSFRPFSLVSLATTISPSVYSMQHTTPSLSLSARTVLCA